jgi:hypothetical protein
MENSSEPPNEESPKKKKTSTKIILGIVAAVVLFIIIMGIWFFGPIKKVPHPEIIPPTAFAFFTINLDPESSGFSDLFETAEREYLNLEPGSFKARVAMKVTPLIIPKRVTIVATLEENSTDPGAIFIISMGKIIKIIRFYSGPFDRVIFRGAPFKRENIRGHRFKLLESHQEGGVIDRLTNPAAYTFINNNIIVGSNLTLLKSTYYNYKGAKPSDPMNRGLLYRRMEELLSPAQDQADISMVVDNNGGRLSRIIKSYEEKYTFAAFPSIDYVTSIDGSLSILNEEMDSSITFFCSNPDKLMDLRSDVKFIYGAVRRKLKASGINMKGEILVEEDSVIFSFKITDFMDAILTPSES